MRGLRVLAAAALAAGMLAPQSYAAQQSPAAAPAVAPAASPAQIKQDLERIKKGRTVALTPADGMEEADDATVLRFDNASSFSLVVLVVGPTTQRIELEAERMQSLTVEPGNYEIAITAIGRDVPPFYGKQKIVANMHFQLKLVIP